MPRTMIKMRIIIVKKSKKKKKLWFPAKHWVRDGLGSGLNNPLVTWKFFNKKKCQWPLCEKIYKCKEYKLRNHWLVDCTKKKKS